jgi:hypothetical protein
MQRPSVVQAVETAVQQIAIADVRLVEQPTALEVADAENKTFKN